MCKISPPATKSGALNTGRCTRRVLEDRAAAREAVVVRGHHTGGGAVACLFQLGAGTR